MYAGLTLTLHIAATRLDLIAKAVASKWPDVLVVIEVMTGRKEGGLRALTQLTSKLNELAEECIWESRRQPTYSLMVTPTATTGTGSEGYGLVWNTTRLGEAAPTYALWSNCEDDGPFQLWSGEHARLRATCRAIRTTSNETFSFKQSPLFVKFEIAQRRFIYVCVVHLAPGYNDDVKKMTNATQIRNEAMLLQVALGCEADEHALVLCGDLNKDDVLKNREITGSQWVDRADMPQRKERARFFEHFRRVLDHTAATNIHPIAHKSPAKKRTMTRSGFQPPTFL
jgi:endonuclease/exonuclease/phosphatase family metal-dependent hydrolase